MAQIIWTEPALLDLNEIAEYIALDKFDAAQRLIKLVFSRVEDLKRFPESGRKPPEIAKSRYREVIVGPCRVFYRVTGDKIIILYVMRGERQLRKFILSDRESHNS
ncbi:MAG: type II toxin-antitoxin system RelE/ParE family toxin [Proteobacteria bacterium]|nr:type II toxin-antitoxin system RelE/ParE family toxin [Pseudomonadota bacterium]